MTVVAGRLAAFVLVTASRRSASRSRTSCPGFRSVMGVHECPHRTRGIGHTGSAPGLFAEVDGHFGTGYTFVVLSNFGRTWWVGQHLRALLGIGAG